MSDTDSFIEEVSEEVRRDRLFGLMKKYGWIGILLVILLVGGAAFNEWRNASNRAAAEGLGNDILTAFQAAEPGERATAITAIKAEGANTALLGLLSAGALASADDDAGAVAALQVIAGDVMQPQNYRHLAELKLILMGGNELSADERLSRLAPLAVPGAPFRLLAEEQMAIAEISAGQNDAALTRLTAILADQEVTAGLRRRVSQLIVALGGELAPA